MQSIFKVACIHPPKDASVWCHEFGICSCFHGGLGEVPSESSLWGSLKWSNFSKSNSGWNILWALPGRGGCGSWRDGSWKTQPLVLSLTSNYMASFWVSLSRKGKLGGGEKPVTWHFCGLFLLFVYFSAAEPFPLKQNIMQKPKIWSKYKQAALEPYAPGQSLFPKECFGKPGYRELLGIDAHWSLRCLQLGVCRVFL